MRIVLALLMAAHGLAHLPGFLVSWRLQTLAELPYRTTIVGTSLDVGEAGIKAVGVVWLAVGVAFVVLAGATLARVAYLLVGVSAVLCFAGWPDARLGLVANAIILLLVAISSRTTSH
jgi:uncharacterized membrane protein YccF (DUF307 family)